MLVREEEKELMIDRELRILLEPKLLRVRGD